MSMMPEGLDEDVYQEDKLKEVVKPPSLYNVILLNDDYTEMGFVISVLQQIFNKGFDEAFQVMLRIHTEGKAVAGTYSKEIAEMKVYKVVEIAREYEFPLKAITEKE